MSKIEEDEAEKSTNIANAAIIASQENDFIKGSKIVLHDFCFEFVEDGFKHGYMDGYAAAQSQSGWVSIADIPEEWKVDDFLVDLFVETEGCRYRLKDCIFINGRWEDETGLEHNGVTHARLPPPSPKEQE